MPVGETRALVGRNGAGKSTLVGILTGLISPDTGDVRFLGRPAPPVTAREQWRELVGCVYQRSTVILTMTVGENIFLNAYPQRRSGFLSWRAIRAEGRRLLDEWGIEADVDALASELPPGQRQLVEIVRALRLGSRFIILDEPTAQLEAAEIDLLFRQMRHLHDAGVSFLYISHHLDEIYEVCDSVTILRDGHVVLNAAVKGLGKEQIVDAMVGEAAATRAIAPRATRDAAPGDTGQPVLAVRDLTWQRWFSKIDLDVYQGECVGLAGLAASGKAQLADVIIGLVKPDGGRVLLNGRAVPAGRVDGAIDRGLGFLPGDRQTQGFCPDLSVEENITMTVLDDLGPWGSIDHQRRGRRALALIERMHVLVSSPQQRPVELSGGNQQKMVFGRAVASNPQALVLVSPTAGVDVASKRLLLETITQAGTAVLLVSDELDELAICDRVIVMFGGRVVREFARGWYDAELIGAMEGVAHRHH
ncbi:MAG: simple sugar transport system ATP-binding protein [Chloroflexota bacterium]|nr:simple sugar transport system ATP-binding protein [Chloroflexota bacterium]